MKKILLLTIAFFIMVNAHQYDIYDMNGKKLGTYNEDLNFSTLKYFVKKYHNSILVKKNTIQKFNSLNNKSLAQIKQIEKKFNLNSNLLDNEQWLEVEKNEIIKLCLDKNVLAWETSLYSEIINDSCLVIQAPMFIGIETLSIFSQNADSAQKINLAIGMKYLEFDKEDVLLGYNTGNAGIRVTTSKKSYIAKEEDPERNLNVTATYLVDKYPVTNCEITLSMWDDIPEDSTNINTEEDEHTKKWIIRKESSIQHKTCITHDSAANSISLYQAMKYANIRSIRDGLKPSYIFSSTTNTDVEILSKGKYTISTSDFKIHNDKFIQVSIDYSSNGYRIPFYDEWMMFARARDKSNQAPWGNQSASLDEISKYAMFNKETYYGESAPVGLLHPNKFNLYDIFGLVEEHVLFEELNPFKYYRGSPSCFKGGNLHSNWQYINYGYTTANYYSANLGGFRLIRKLK